MLFLLPNKKGVEIPSTIMKHMAQTMDPQAIILFGDEATSQNARAAILQNNPPYVFTTGHGIPCATTLQDNQPFISLNIPDMNRQVCNANRNLDIFKGRVIHIMSCWTGKLLARVLVQKYGAWAVFAYDDEFLFLLPEDGKTIDIIVAAPFLAAYTVDIAMLSGATAGEAHEEQMKAFDRWIEYFYRGEGSKLKGAPLVLRVLIADKSISRLYGDPTATVTKRRPVPQVKLTLPLEVEGGEKVNPILLAIPIAMMMFGRG